MKYCSKCGAEMKDEDIFCAKCGHSVTVSNTQNSNKGKAIAIYVFMILSCVVALFGNYYFKINGKDLFEGFGRIISIATLAWKLPMTIITFIRLQKGKNLPLAFKICTLLFVSLIAGILMLCLKDNQPTESAAAVSKASNGASDKDIFDFTNSNNNGNNR